MECSQSRRFAARFATNNHGRGYPSMEKHRAWTLLLPAFLGAVVKAVQWDAHGGLGVIDLSAQSWTQIVNGRSTVLVDYYTPWCPQCRALEPKLEAAARQLPNVQIARVNAEEEPGLKMRYHVHDYPELHLFLPGASEPLSYMGELNIDLIVDWVRETQRAGGKVAAGDAPRPPRDTSWMRELASALAPSSAGASGGCQPGQRCHDPDHAGGAAASSTTPPPPAEDQRAEPNDADSAMRLAMDDAMHDAAAEANQKSMRVVQELRAQEAAQRAAQQAQAASKVQGALGEVLPLLPTLKAIAASREFEELAQLMRRNLDTVSDEQVAYLQSRPSEERVPLMLGLLLNLTDEAVAQLGASLKKLRKSGGDHPFGLTPMLRALLTPAAHLVPADHAAAQMAPLVQALLSGVAPSGSGGGAQGGGGNAVAVQRLMSMFGSLGGHAGGTAGAGGQQQPAAAGADLLQQMMAAAGGLAATAPVESEPAPPPEEAPSRGGAGAGLPRYNMRTQFG